MTQNNYIVTSKIEQFHCDLWSKALVLVNLTVLEIFCQDLLSKALVLVNPTVLEI